MAPFLSTDSLCCGKATEKKLDIFCIQLLPFCVGNGNLSSLGKNIVCQGAEITQGTFSGGLFLMRSICLRWAMEQIMENGCPKEDRKKIRKQKRMITVNITVVQSA